MRDNTHISSHQLVEIYRKALLKGLPLDKLDQQINRKLEQAEVSKKIHHKQEENRVKKIKHSLPRAVRYGALTIPVLFMGVGIYLLGNAILPIVQYYTTTVPTLSKKSLAAPIPPEEVLDVTPFVLAETTQNMEDDKHILGSADRESGPVILDTKLDYTNLTNWFQDDRSQVLAQAESEEVYTIDIPKVDIENATVTVGGTDLNKSLIAYPGTALPGKAGAPVIFGHSVLRQFYSPAEKNPRRYNSIFSYIMTLQPGDEIFVTYQGVKYTYVVRSKSEVKPEDTYILAQQYDNRMLKLVTCVPEGTYLRRGVVTAELVSG